MTDQEFKETILEINNSTLPIPTQQRIIKELEGSRWIPVDEKSPENDTYVLVSFENFTMPDIARYEEDKAGGIFYPGDEERSYKSYGPIVNAWKPLPVTYKNDNSPLKRMGTEEIKKCRECVHTRASCHHRGLKCSECPLTELFCDEFYVAIDRCYEDAMRMLMQVDTSLVMKQENMRHVIIIQQQ